MDSDNPQEGIIAYFALSFKEVDLTGAVSRTTVRKLDGISRSTKKVRVFLLGQVAKNDHPAENLAFSEILQLILSKLLDAHEAVGGRTLLLECEDNEKLISLYEATGFKVLQKEELVQMYKILDFEE